MNLIWISLVFFLSLFGLVFFNKSLINLLITLEILLFCVGINFALTSLVLDDLYGQLFFLIILAIAAAESAIGLAVIVIFYRSTQSIDLRNLNNLKG